MLAKMSDEQVTKQVTRSSLVTETVNGSIMFEVKGYSAAKGMGVGKGIFSDEFTVGGHSWAIQFYPDGFRRKHKSKYVSLYIKLGETVGDVWALSEVTVMDQSGKGEHKLVTNFKRVLPFKLQSGCRLGYSRFCRKTTLEASNYLRDDCLKFYCTVGVVVDCSMLRSINIPDSDIGSHIGMLLENVEGCDITFNVSGEKFQAHKLILAARSTKFRSDFLEGVDRGGEEVIVQDMEPNVFKALLHFIYKDALAESELITFGSGAAPKVADTLTAKLLAAADRYDLKRLKTMCESQLFKDISVNSVTQVLALADLCHAEELKVSCRKFAAENLEDFINGGGLKSDAQIAAQLPPSGGLKSKAQIAAQLSPSGGDDEDWSGGRGITLSSFPAVAMMKIALFCSLRW